MDAQTSGRSSSRRRAVRAAAAALSVTAAALTTTSPALADKPQRHNDQRLGWRVGFAKESVDPRPCPSPDPGVPCDLNSNFHLGGFGLGPTRVALGPLVDGDGAVENIYARAMAISNRRGQTLLLAMVENQGMFAAYKQGPYGLYDIRAQVSHDTGVPIDSIVINTDHSHAGPDMIGIWGGVPVSYLQLVRDRTVKALEEAYGRRVPARLLVGTDAPVMPDATAGHYLKGTATAGEFFDHSQFGVDTGPISTAQQQGLPVPNPPSPTPTGATGYRDDLVDTQLRVLQAYSGSGKPLGTLINYAAHADVMGGGNVLYSADWPGRVAGATETALGEPVALTMVADVGRTQPPRPNSDAKCDTPGHVSCDVDKLDTWTRLFTPWVLEAVKAAVPVRGTTIASKETFTREVVTNPALFAVTYSGEAPARGYGAYRGSTAPWMSGNVLGTFVSVHRLGDIMLSANPGEAYPDIRFGVLNEVAGLQAEFTFGLANDQLGYLIAPASEYPWISYSNVGNDNSFFNVSANYGDHDYCTQTAGAVAIGFPRTTANPKPYGAGAIQPRCKALTATDVVPIGPTPQQPWSFGDGVAAPALPVSP
jgi:hypothetical protein